MNAAPATHACLAHVFFVHSPITYSLAQAVIRQQSIAAPILIGGRAMTGPGIAAAVEDDGCWSIDRTCQVLARIADVVDADRPIALYLPHTAMLFGKLIKLSRRVVRLFYVEEGYTSAKAAHVDKPFALTRVDLPALRIALSTYCLMDAWRFDESGIEQLNETPEIAFDSQCPAYAGSYIYSADAFPGMPSLTRMPLAIDPVRRPVRLISFFGMINRYGTTPTGIANVETSCRSLIHVVHSIRESGVKQGVLVKLHPVDQQKLPEALKRGLQQLGVDYATYCHAHGLDANLEPALHNFEHYYTFGETAMVKYIKLLLGEDRLTEFVAK